MVKTKGATCGLIMCQVLGSHSSVRSDKPLNKTFSIRSVQYGAGPLFRDVLESLGTHLIQDLVPGWWWSWPPVAPALTGSSVPVEVVPDPRIDGTPLASPIIGMDEFSPS